VRTTGGAQIDAISHTKIVIATRERRGDGSGRACVA
jgi:hypothetical protein